jgi:LacI family transcriptional regulator
LRTEKSILLLTGTMVDFRMTQLAKGILNECHRLNWGLSWKVGVQIKRGTDLGRTSAVIARMDKASMLQLRKDLPPEIPLVSADGATLDTDIPTVTPDPFAIGRITAEHFLEQGVRSFIIAGSPSHISAKYRRDAFTEVVNRTLEHAALKTLDVAEGELFWGSGSALEQRFMRLLKKSPLPAGVMAASDAAAVSCLECLQDTGLRCPADVAIVGSSNDPVYTNILMPLSSIQVDFEKAGAEAIDMLQEIFASQDPGKNIAHRYLPVELIVRKSSQHRLMADERIAKAIHILQARYTDDLRLPELAAQCGMSRAGFCSKFTDVVGESPIQYLINYRLEKARLLLTDSNLNIGQIIEEVGFNDQPYFTRTFRQRFQMTPTQYRKSMLQREGRAHIRDNGEKTMPDVILI